MGVLSKKLRSGVVELATDTGPLYASPTLRQRVYLLWIFRHFHRLSHQVLNQRQREVVDKLCRASTLRRYASAPIIGVVENARVASQRKSVAAAIKSTESALAQAVGAASVSVPGRIQSPNTPLDSRWLDTRPVRRPSTVAVAKSRPPSVLGVPRQWLASGVALTAGIAILVGLIYVRHSRSASAAVRLQFEEPYAPSPPAGAAASGQPQPTVDRQATAKPSAARGITPRLPSAVIVQPTHATPPAPASFTATAAGATLPAPGQPVPSRSINTEGAARPAAIASADPVPPVAGIAHEVTSAEVTSSNVTPIGRLVIAAAPLSFSYPESPNANLIGRVHLRVFVAADGSVKEVAALTGNRALADAAVRAVRRWRYRPPQLNGQPIEAETNVTINFAGDDAVTIAFR